MLLFSLIIITIGYWFGAFSLVCRLWLHALPIQIHKDTLNVQPRYTITHLVFLYLFLVSHLRNLRCFSTSCLSDNYQTTATCKFFYKPLSSRKDGQTASLWLQRNLRSSGSRHVTSVSSPLLRKRRNCEKFSDGLEIEERLPGYDTWA